MGWGKTILEHALTPPAPASEPDARVGGPALLQPGRPSEYRASSVVSRAAFCGDPRPFIKRRRKAARDENLMEHVS